MRRNAISLQDIKFTLLKLREPFDGWMDRPNDIWPGSKKTLRELFRAYLDDLKNDSAILDYSIEVGKNEKSHVFNVYVSMGRFRNPDTKLIPIYVDYFKEPWCGGDDGRKA